MRKVLAKPLKVAGQCVFGDTNVNTIRSGNWYGNDTTWRMVLDLNRIPLYADKNGHLTVHPTRRVFCLVDSIIGGEGNGPLDPIPKPTGVVLAGANPVAVDLVCAFLMGFDYTRLPMLYWAFADHPMPLCGFEYNDVVCKSGDPHFNRALCEFRSMGLSFEPHFGWKGHVELHDTYTSEVLKNLV
jgi:hypothetical protein